MAEKQSIMKKRDIFIVAAVLAVAAVGMIAVRFLTGGKTPDQARIYVGPGVYKVVDLNEDQIVTIDQGSGKVNHVEIKDGSIFMSDSTCPDQQCVYQDSMSMDNYEKRILRNWIVCLPNEVTIELILDEG